MANPTCELRGRAPDSSSPVRKILLTGANGQLGWELRRSLQGLGEVVALTRQMLDLSDSDMIRSVVRTQQPSLIVNAAAYTAVDQAESDSVLAHRINAIAPGVLAEEVKRLDVPLVHYSTDYVFDGEKPQPYDERDAPCPRNVYGESKLMGERAVQATGCQHLIFRTSWLYSGRGKNFVKTMLNLTAQKQALRVVVDQCGAPTWARTVADATADIVAKHLIDLHSAENLGEPGNASPACVPTNRMQGLTADWWDKHSGIYHLCADGRTSWAEFANTIFALKGIDCTVVPIASSEYPTPAQRPRNSCLSNEKLIKVLGVYPPHWRHALAEFLNEMPVDAK